MEVKKMVDVEYQPVKKVVVHEAIKYDLDEFLRMKAQALPNGQPPQAVRWVDGLVFAFNGMALTPELVNERVRDGVIHWEFIEFAEMPKYEKVVTHPDTQVQLRVVDGSNNSAVGDVIRHFKNNTTFFPQTTN